MDIGYLWKVYNLVSPFLAGEVRIHLLFQMPGVTFSVNFKGPKSIQHTAGNQVLYFADWAKTNMF